MPHPCSLRHLLARIAPPGLAWSAGAIGDRAASPYHEEEEAVRTACAPRRREFRAGRFHARRAMVRLGVPAQAIPRLRDRAPGWPPDHVGSITHSHSHCVAVVAVNRRLIALGIDIEPLAPVSPRLAAAILAPEERCAGAEHGLLRAFAAKEAVFKACAPALNNLPDFRDIAIRWADDSAGFVAEVRGGARPIVGAWGVAGGHLVALAWSAAA